MATEANHDRDQGPSSRPFRPNVFVDSLPTQSSLISRLKFQEADAWGNFVDIYAPLIFQWCRASSLTNEDCADVTQNVFAKLHRSIGQYDRMAHSRFRSWLWVVTRNTIRDYCRGQKRDIQSEGGTEFHRVLKNLPAADEEPTDENWESQLLDRAMKVVERDVDPKTWRAFWLLTMENHSTDSVAQQVSMSKNSVRQAKSRVLRRLRELLEEH